MKVCVCVYMRRAFYGTATPSFECAPALRHQAYKGMRSNAELYLTQIDRLFKNIDKGTSTIIYDFRKKNKAFKISLCFCLCSVNDNFNSFRFLSVCSDLKSIILSICLVQQK